MAYKFVTIGVIVLLSAALVSGTSLPLRTHLHAQAAPGGAPLRAYGVRGPAQRLNAADGKLDGALSELAALARPGQAIADLHSLSPAARFHQSADGTALVSVDAITVGDPQRLKAALESLGLQRAAVYKNDVGGWLPVAQLRTAAAHAEVHALRAALSRTRTGAVTSQGDFVQQSAAVRASDALTGSGITVGILSDSYDCYSVYAANPTLVPASGYAGYAFNGFTATAADDVASGDLPAGVTVLEEADCLSYGQPVFTPFGDEGRAMMQIVHDVAPGAALVFYTAESSEADFAAGIGKLATAGAGIIADDVGYFDEPFYQDGLVAQAVDAAETAGAAYFVAAGNDGNASYENTAPSFATLASSGPNAGEYLLNFDPSGATTTTALPITLDAMAPGEFTAIILEWDQPYVTGAPTSGGATSSLDLCVTGATGGFTIEDYDGNTVTCTGPNATGVDPVQILIVANPANATASTAQTTLNLVVGLANAPHAPGRVKVAVETDGQADPPITTFATNSATIQGHAGAAGAATVAAAFYFSTPACGTTPAAVETYSSQGGSPILFDVDGNRLATQIVRQKPDFTGPDGGNDTFLGFTLASGGITGSNGFLTTTVSQCQNDPSYPNFFGTSAATPHAAGIAALMLQANSSITPTQIYEALRSTALPMGAGAGYSVDSGFGFIQAPAALAAIPPDAPTLSASPVSVVTGSKVTLTWSSVNAASCAATGGWSGAQATSGSVTVTPSTVGSVTYGLSCTNAAGTSSVASTSVTVTAAPPAAGGGGGRSDPSLLLGLAALVSVRLFRASRCQLSS